jgi:3-deoxy-manno-octulosonate cytidylyltransferase (CMP-KDO synthetase)
MSAHSVVIVIPARFESVRFPGKPLVLLNGVSLIERCHRSATAVPGVDAVYVATDDERIQQHVESFGGRALLTPRECRNGTERCAAALALLDSVPEMVVNWQGDSPLISSEYVTALIDCLRSSSAADLVTPAIRCDGDLLGRLKADRAVGRVGGTMVVVSKSKRAGYFSKELIPYADRADESSAHEYYYHIGMYAYRPQTLQEYINWPVGPLERIEGLEQLRFIENDRTVEVVTVEGRGHWEVNNPEDVPLVESLLIEHGIK